MNRKHSRQEYLNLIQKIRELMPDCSISHDMIAGFSSENEKDAN